MLIMACVFLAISPIVLAVIAAKFLVLVARAWNRRHYYV